MIDEKGESTKSAFSALKDRNIDKKRQEYTPAQKGGFFTKFLKGDKPKDKRDTRNDRDRDRIIDIDRVDIDRDRYRGVAGRREVPQESNKKMLLPIIICAVVVIVAAIFLIAKPKHKFLFSGKMFKKSVTQKIDSSDVALADTFKTDTLLINKTVSNQPNPNLNQNLLSSQASAGQVSNVSNIGIKQVGDANISGNQSGGLKTGQTNDSVTKESEHKFTKALESMEPTDVVPIMDSLDDNTVLDLLLKMKSKKVADILNAMNPGRAARLIKKLSGKNLPIEAQKTNE